MSKVMVEETQQEKDDRALLDALVQLGGQRIADEDLERKGNKLILPERWSANEAISFLKAHIRQQEEETSFSRTYRYRPLDGAHAVQSALRRVFGTAGLGKATFSFFGRNPPQLISVATGVDSTVQIPWGAMEVPLFGGTMYLGATHDAEYGSLFALTIETQRRFKAHVEGLFQIVAEELRKGSIYKGQAINGAEQPEFLDLRGVSADKVIYSDEVTVQLEANIWSLLRHTDKMRSLGMPLKRAVLLEGPFGCGKTLGAFLTAQEAVNNGWTFIYCRPGKDELDTVMQTARLYQPAVVFFEDVDTIASSGDRDHVSQLLDTFDGITSKGTELMAVLTTNHKESIVKGMLRPGRLDALIHIGALDTSGVQRMIESTVDASLLRNDLDYDAIAQAMGVGTDDGFLPAFVKESIDRTVRYSLARNNGEPGILTTEDFIHAALGLRPQLDLMNGANEGKMPDTLGGVMRREIADVVSATTIERGGAAFGTLAVEHDNGRIK